MGLKEIPSLVHCLPRPRVLLYDLFGQIRKSQSHGRSQGRPAWDWINLEPEWLKPMTKNCWRDWSDLRLEKNFGEHGIQPRPGETQNTSDVMTVLTICQAKICYACYVFMIILYLY